MVHSTPIALRLTQPYTNKKSGFTFRTNLFQNYSDNSYWVDVNKKEGSKILSEKTRVRRFHDDYDSKTAIVDVGFVDKKFADQLFGRCGAFRQ